MRSFVFHLFFFFNDTATTEIYTLSLHDALPISLENAECGMRNAELIAPSSIPDMRVGDRDRKSTRLNSSHLVISYAVFCLKKKNYINRVLRRARYFTHKSYSFISTMYYILHPQT